MRTRNDHACRPRLTLDSYFEKASGSGSASVDSNVYGCLYFSMQNEVPIVSELPRFAQEGRKLPHPPLWWAQPLYKS